MSKIHTDYNAYLLRVWIERDASMPSGTTTRISLQDVEKGQRVGFRNIADLINFLENQAILLNDPKETNLCLDD